MSYTPRTDEHAFYHAGVGSKICTPEFAGRLERELSAANARIAELENHLSPKTLIDEIVDERKEEA